VFQPGPVEIDSRVADNSEDTLVAAMMQVQLNTGEKPPRPGFGTKGVVVKVPQLILSH
jgi:hypothetical protein